MLEEQMFDWGKHHDLVAWSVEKIERLEKLEKKISQTFASTRKVLKQSASYVRESFDRLSDISLLTRRNYLSFSKICQSIMDKHFLIKILHLLNLFKCQFDIDFSGSFMDARYFFRSLWYDLKTNTLDSLNDKIDSSIEKINRQFKFDAKYERNFTNRLDASKSYKKVLQNLAVIYYERLEFVYVYLQKCLSVLFPVSLILVLQSALKYHNRYLRTDHYKNNIIGVKFHELEEKRRLNGQITLLPLDEQLHGKYIGLFDLNLTKVERDYTFKSLINLCVLLLPIVLALVCDHFLLRVNEYMHDNTLVEIELEPVESMSTEINGHGFLASIYSELFEILGNNNNQNTFKKYTLSLISCLQNDSRGNASLVEQI